MPKAPFSLMLAIAVAGSPCRLVGQDAPATPSRVPAVRAWLSAGMGPGAYYHTSGLALRAAATLMVDRAVVMFRGTSTFDGIDSYDWHDASALLAGWQFGNKRVFLVPAIGAARVHWKDGGPCAFGPPCSGTLEQLGYEVRGVALAYDVGLHANYRVIGLGVNFSAVTGAQKKSQSALVLSAELGWFGK